MDRQTVAHPHNNKYSTDTQNNMSKSHKYPVK